MAPKRSRQPGASDGSEDPTTPKRLKVNKISKPCSVTSSKTPTKSRIISSPAKPNRNKLVVSIDYGTTFSGAAFVTTNNSDARDVQVIADWLGGARKNDQLEKVPSRIAFAKENEGLTTDKWGYEVEAHMKSYAWTKLLLDSDAATTTHDSEVLCGKMRKGLFELPADMSAQEVVTAYLSKLYNHIMDRLTRTYSASILKITPINFWFTVPATWQDSANDATRSAASDAGFGSREDDEVFMITEPEAAAIAILSQAVDKTPGLYKVGTNVLIADLGGGTLDFQCLTIENLEPLRTEETIPGIGGKSGSTFIDCNLHQWLGETFGEAFTKLPSSKTGPGSKLMDDFELVKKTFNGKDLNKTYHISLPALGKALRDKGMASSAYDSEDNEILLSGHNLAQMFQPVLNNAFALMNEQLRALKKERKLAFKVVCLCGGLGGSEYVWQQFDAYCKENLGESCHLVTDERAWSAVVRGAAVRGLDGSMVLSKRAKRCYGIAVHQPFREGIDNEAESFVCPIKGKRAENYIDWVVKRGRRFTPNFRAESKVYISISEEDDEEDMVFFWKLYSCALEEAPIKVGEKGVEEIGTIRLDLSESFKKRKNPADIVNGAEAADIKVVMKLGNERGILMVEAMHNRTVVGTASIDFTRSHARRPARSAGLL